MSGADQIRLPLRLKDQASFENFLIGDNQQIISLLQDPAGNSDVGVIYLHGPRGVGKSHLLQACCRAHLQSPDAPAYVSLSLDGVRPEMITDL
ncbi:MAG: hypothetical protein HN428_07490, partial [Proteobacteria bacterium]|nr:hypothetical protein [Pseudomonadota bacterium]